MANKTITISITGPEEVVTPSLNVFAMQYGWEAEVKDEKGDMVPNPTTASDKAKGVLRGFIIDSIKAYNVGKAQDVSRKSAMDQTDTAVELTVMTLELT